MALHLPKKGYAVSSLHLGNNGSMLIFVTVKSDMTSKSWTEPSIRRVSSSRVGLVVGKKPNP